MKRTLHWMLLFALFVGAASLGGCSAEEVGEDTDQLGEEIDFDEQ